MFHPSRSFVSKTNNSHWNLSAAYKHGHFVSGDVNWHGNAFSELTWIPHTYRYSSGRRYTTASNSSFGISNLSRASFGSPWNYFQPSQRPYFITNNPVPSSGDFFRGSIEYDECFATSPADEDQTQVLCNHGSIKESVWAQSSIPRNSSRLMFYPPIDENSTLYYDDLAKLSLTENELYLNGYPMKQSESGSVFVYTENFFKRSANIENESIELGEFLRRFEANTSPAVIQGGYYVKKCIRCDEFFAMSSTNEYLTKDRCRYHPGRLIGREYSCCYGRWALGCQEAARHVWTAYNDGLNGPMEGYVQTEPKHPSIPKNRYGIFGVDCEMGFTSEGFELIKVSIVNVSGQVVYETLVEPKGEIVDLNTKYSGVFLEDFVETENLKSLDEVQEDLLHVIGSESLLVGHSLEGDLKALKIVHEHVVDTSLLFHHPNGLPYRNGLKKLTKRYLNRDIQNGINGHNSAEDALAALDLALWRVKNNFQ